MASKTSSLCDGCTFCQAVPFSSGIDRTQDFFVNSAFTDKHEMAGVKNEPHAPKKPRKKRNMSDFSKLLS